MGIFSPTRMMTLALMILGVAIIIGVYALYASRPDPVEILILPPEPTGTPEPTPTPAPITVYLTGAIATPDILLVLPHGSRVEDAINRAGGLRDDADRERVNLAAILRDGDQVHVFSEREDAVDGSLATPSGGLIPINRATLEELQALPGVGPSLGQRIIDHRETFGPILDAEALDEVSGIGPALLEAILPLITFE